MNLSNFKHVSLCNTRIIDDEWLTFVRVVKMTLKKIFDVREKTFVYSFLVLSNVNWKFKML